MKLKNKISINDYSIWRIFMNYFAYSLYSFKNRKQILYNRSCNNNI